MIKKSILITGFASMILLTGCQMTDEGQPSLQRSANYDQGGHQHYPMTRMNQDGDYANYGYIRYQKEQIEDQQEFIPMFDRNRLADGVTRMVLTNNVVNEAAALVTDKYVLVAYDSQTDNREFVADQVKRSALSIVPRYYQVYISDNHDHFDDIERFQNLSSAAPNMEGSLQQTIQEMQQSPQGQYNEDTDDNMEIMEQKQRRLMDK